MQDDGGVVVIGPEILGAAVELVEALGDLAIDPGHEAGQLGAGVGDDGVEVIVEDLQGVDLDVVEASGAVEAVEDDLLGDGGGFEQELALSGPASEQVGGLGQDLSRQGHGDRYRPLA